MAQSTSRSPSWTPFKSDRRLRAGVDLIDALASRLTDRDRYLCRMLYEHRVLTISQIAALAFDSVSAAQHRLVLLTRYRLVDRFRPFRPTGSAPFHYVLDRGGAALLAGELGLDPKQVSARADKALAFAHSQRLAHLLATNDFFVSLAAQARRDGPRTRLAAWWAEARCTAVWGEMVRPDGYGRWDQDGRTVRFFLECDLATETHDRLARKLTDYSHVYEARAEPPTDRLTTAAVLFWFTSHAREQTFHIENAKRAVPVATAVAQPGRAPSGRLWRPLGHEDSRLTLADAVDAALAVHPPKFDDHWRRIPVVPAEQALREVIDPTWPPAPRASHELESVRRLRTLMETAQDGGQR